VSDLEEIRMERPRRIGKSFRRTLAAALAAGGLCGPGPAWAVLKSAAGEKVVLHAGKRCGASLSAPDRSAVEDALLARAWEAGVVVCHDGSASPAPPSLDGICARPGPEVAPLWWDLKIETRRSEGTQVASATLRLALSDGPPREAPELFLLGPFVLSPGTAEAAAREEVLRAVTGSLGSSPALLGWLRSLSSRRELLRVHAPSPGSPEEASVAPAMDPRPMPDAAGDPAGSWNAEILRITDLLIDGTDWKVREAWERASRLLREAGLPPDIAARARDLRGKAAAKLESAVIPNSPNPSTEPSTAGPPAPVLADREEPAGRRPDRIFPARMAVAGKGFGVGSEGELRLTPEGIAFQPKGQVAREWAVPWNDLASVSRDDGLWESPYTLLLVERTGRKRYLSLVDGHGHYVTGDPLLKAIAAEKRASRQGEQR
jgi:hypothetical protein